MINCDVVILDSGISLDNELSVPGICIEKTNDGFFVSDNLADETGHGTGIYNIISKYANDSSIYIVKLSEGQDYRDDSCLINALRYIKQNINCKIINVSLGVKAGENLDKLYKLCKKISDAGTTIVSAFDNEGCHSYPATFDCVIGVDSGDDFKHVAEFDFVENSPINIIAKGTVQRLTTQDGKTSLVGGTSVACAYITSIVYNEMKNNLNFYDVLSALKSKSRYIFTSKNMSKKDTRNSFFKITNAVVFPFAKESHAFVRFSEILPFNIKGFYDVRRTGKVGRKLSSYCKNTGFKENILDIEQIDFTDIDTIILGHLDELHFATKRDFKTDLVKKAIAARVNIYSFDPLDPYIELLNDSDIKYFFPQVTNHDLPQNTFGKLYKISKPVVGIFGTSSQQGKFSLQLALKTELKSHGYDVGTVGTEPHSLLFGLDVVFPMGYNSTVQLENNEIVLYLNDEINKLCLHGKEIILVATQSQIVPYYCNNLLEFPSMQYHFALGTKPDVIIMCVNYHDELEYIKNSLYALIGLTDASIIAFVMYPIAYSNEWNGTYGCSKYEIDSGEFEQKSYILQKEFQIPVYMLGDMRHMSDLCQKVIDQF